MKKQLLISAAAIALLTANGAASAQGMQERPQAPKAQMQGESKGGAELRGTTGQAAPAEKTDSKPADVKGRADVKSDIKAGEPKPDMKTRADTKSDMKTRAESKPVDTKADVKSTADTKSAADPKSKMDNKADAKSDAKSTTTTGQGAAGSQANLSTEQRTQIKTVIKQTSVRPVTNVNFSISVGSRVPRTVKFYPLPVQVVEYYPAWRGYEFILVGDEILVINPRTLEIVAVLEA